MDKIKQLLGPFPEVTNLNGKTIEQVDCGSYIREKISYGVETGERVTAYVCIPKGLTFATPAIFYHHQHHGQFDIGKSEVVGLTGDPDQAYASELAEKGYITFSPDAIAFEERNWATPGSSEYYELSSRLVKGETLMAKVLHDSIQGLNYLVRRPEVDENRISFIGHSYGGRMALWLPTPISSACSNVWIPCRDSIRSIKAFPSLAA